MISALLGDWLPWLVGGIAALAGIWGYGRQQRGQGRKDANDQRRMDDLKEAADVRDKVDAAKRDGNAAERLRARGKLRDGDEG